MDDLSEEELRNYVRQFLDEIKALILENGLIVTDREKNRASLLALSLTERQREEIILSLSVLDYSSGPTKDEYKPGHYWVFSKQIEGAEIYIKLKIGGEPGAERAICFSFHKSEKPLNHPFKK